MKYGFSFKGTHTKEFAGLTVKTTSRPIKSDMRDAVFTAPYMDGSISTASNNPYGREFYESRQFVVTMFLTAENLVRLNKKLAKISSWLTGSGELIFDDAPLIIWDARAAGSVDYAPERAGKKAVLTITFEVQPFGRLAWHVTDGPELGQDGIYLGDNLPLGMGTGGYTVTVESLENLIVSQGILNYGDRPVRPVITFRTLGSGSVPDMGIITIRVNGDSGNEMTLYAGNEVKTFIADCEKHALTNIDGKNIMGRNPKLVNFSGRFIELPPGENRLIITRRAGASAADIEITVDFMPRYMWDADFDAVDWG